MEIKWPSIIKFVSICVDKSEFYTKSIEPGHREGCYLNVAVTV